MRFALTCTYSSGVERPSGSKKICGGGKVGGKRCKTRMGSWFGKQAVCCKLTKGGKRCRDPGPGCPTNSSSRQAVSRAQTQSQLQPTWCESLSAKRTILSSMEGQ